MSNPNNSISEDRPEFTRGDLVEVFNPETKAYQWVEVEDVLHVHGAQILLARGDYFCACLVRVESLATPGINRSKIERQEDD